MASISNPVPIPLPGTTDPDGSPLDVWNAPWKSPSVKVCDA